MSSLSVCIFTPSVEKIQQLLSSDRYRLYPVQSVEEVGKMCANPREGIDCLIIHYRSEVLAVFNQLGEQGILLPVVIVNSFDNDGDKRSYPTHLYHSGEIHINSTEIDSIVDALDRAIARFLRLGTSCALTAPEEAADEPPEQTMMLQQRLTQKLKARLGYLGVYYQRDSQDFYRNLSTQAKQQFLQTLRSQYQEIVLSYFSQDSQTELLIDQFVNQAFLSDISVSQVLEIHMELMQEFSQQLKLEGRSEEILLDYRLTLIDVIAHLGEMYRRSIPRETLLQRLSKT